MICHLFVLFCEAAITHFSNIFFLVPSCSCVRQGRIRDEVRLRAQSYLTGLRSIIRSNHTHYTRSETKIKEMSESDPIALFYILEKSRAEIVTLANLERD